MPTTSPPEKRSYRMVARAETAAATRERLLSSAWRHFAAHSFEAVRLADVARDAEVSAQTLHNHFGTKDDLFVAAWRWTMAPEGARRDSAATGDVQAAITVHVDELFARLVAADASAKNDGSRVYGYSE